MDRILKILEKEGNFRLLLCESTDLVETARSRHNTSPVASAALGRTLTATAMMGTMMKGDKDLVSVSIKGDGKLGSITATSNAKGVVKGYVQNPALDIPLKANGKLDVATAVGKGSLYVIKDLGLKDPFNSSVELISGEIAEDLTYYYTLSEQTPSSVGLGVLVNTDLSIKVAGGFILQIMPDCTEEAISQLEQNIARLSSVTDILVNDSVEGLIAILTEGFKTSEVDSITPRFECDCTRDKVEKALISVGKTELESIADEEEEIEMNCHFCNEKYYFSKAEIKDLIANL